MRSNPGYLLKSFLHYQQIRGHSNIIVLCNSIWKLSAIQIIKGVKVINIDFFKSVDFLLFQKFNEFQSRIFHFDGIFCFLQGYMCGFLQPWKSHAQNGRINSTHWLLTLKVCLIRIILYVCWQADFECWGHETMCTHMMFRDD